MVKEKVEQKDQATEQEPKKGKILVVDDSSLMLEVITDTLEMENFEVDRAALTQEAFQFLAKNENAYTSVIVDGLNGKWEGIAKMALRLGIPVTLYTSNPSQYESHELITSKQVSLVQKGGGPDELLASLTQKPDNPD